MSKSQPAKPSARGQRLHLWIDAVGGYLVCLGEEVSLGQAVPAAAVDVPIMAELSRRHARVRRSGEGYVLEPFGKVSVNKQAIEAVTPLADGDEIEMGGGVKLAFRQPHPLSSTARLDFISRHRTQPSVAGVLLFAESCVLGPHTSNHVVCRDWPHDVVLYRQEGELHCRTEGKLEINGALAEGGGPVGQPGHVASDHFSFSIEEA